MYSKDNQISNDQIIEEKEIKMLCEISCRYLIFKLFYLEYKRSRKSGHQELLSKKNCLLLHFRYEEKILTKQHNVLHTNKQSHNNNVLLLLRY